jgi:general secretion pathway protein D
LGWPEASRSVAIMPAGRSPVAPLPPVVVRGSDLSAAPVPQQAGASAGKPGDVTLNFAGADIRDVIGQVLGETLKLNYVIDPEVGGPVTFNVTRPLSREEVLPTLEAVLNSRGATMVQVDGVIRVMPLRKEGKPVAAAPIVHGPAQAIGEHTEVFPLRFVGASEMQHVLEKVLPAGQGVTADDTRHLLVVQGTPSELQLAQDTVRVFDIDQMSGMSMGLVPLATPNRRRSPGN